MPYTVSRYPFWLAEIHPQQPNLIWQWNLGEVKVKEQLTKLFVSNAWLVMPHEERAKFDVTQNPTELRLMMDTAGEEYATFQLSKVTYLTGRWAMMQRPIFREYTCSGWDGWQNNRKILVWDIPWALHLKVTHWPRHCSDESKVAYLVEIQDTGEAIGVVECPKEGDVAELHEALYRELPVPSFTDLMLYNEVRAFRRFEWLNRLKDDFPFSNAPFKYRRRAYCPTHMRQPRLPANPLPFHLRLPDTVIGGE